MQLKEKRVEKITSPAGNRTPVSRVTGGDTHHYTTEDFGEGVGEFKLFICEARNGDG